MPRPATVSVASLPAGGSLAANLRLALAALDLAAAEGADILCLPEVFQQRGVPHAHVREVAEAPDGPILTALGERARSLGLYVLAPLHVADGGRVYNSAVLLDRQGRCVGRYDKIHPTQQELDRGTTPGTSPTPIWQTDFGRIAALICFDINWPEEWEAAARGGAELVLWPSAYPGGYPLHLYAHQHGYFVASATWRDSRVIGPVGQTIASSDDRYRQVTARINLACRLFHQDFNAERLPALRAKYGRRVDIRWYGPEGYFTLESIDPGLDEADIAAEFDLEPMAAYLARMTASQDDARGAAPH